MPQIDTATATVSEGTRLPFARVFAAIGGIYIAQSLVSGMTFQAIPAILRANELPLEYIGLTSLALLPWALKFAWAPWIERYRHSGPDNSRRIVIAGELLVAFAILAIAATGFSSLPVLIALLWLTALASATVDIACDGYAVEQLAANRRGWGNTAQVGGAYIGFMLGGGLYLWLVSRMGFPAASLALAVFVLLLAAPFAFAANGRAGVKVAPSHRASLRFALARPEVRLGLILVFICGVGPRIASALVAPFMVDKKVDLALLGLLNGGVAVAAGLAGTALGGGIVHALGAARAVGVAVGLQALALAGLYAVSTMAAPPLTALVTGMLGLTTAMAIGFVAIYALLMGASSLRQAGVDFTLFQCADAAVATLGGMSGGLLASQLGYQRVFLVTALAATVATIVAWRLGPCIDMLSKKGTP
ncbi:MAG TPA: MFS transporter [Hyphomicrobiaceae bacterium]|nr:MFS transporter [Hyphomicrobiaceae bacterium]